MVNRYFHYLIFINILINVFMFIPSILLSERYKGALISMIIGIFIGTAILLLFVRSINNFRKQTIIDIIDLVPKWFRIVFLLFLVFLWFTAGMVTLLAFTNVTVRFLNPEMPSISMHLIFLGFIVFMLYTLKTEKILHTLEIILVLNVPFLLLILYQAYVNSYLSVNSILEAGTQLWEVPSLKAIAASSFVFSGYANLVVFNRAFDIPFKVKHLWYVPLVCAFALCTSFFIPIGMWGMDGVTDLTFPWIATADTFRIEYGPIERVISLFILTYISLSLISVIIHWHVAYEILKNLLKIRDRKIKAHRYGEITILTVFSGIVLVIEHFLRERQILRMGEMWLIFRLPGELLLLIVVLMIARRRLRGASLKQN
ncbi:GerAB/ArcD/ProY family transporter [Radiobacillus deserti]|uniref:GerAB/ArcD/ProY family transporter n=1 Tax=Radiobacillus deserti TaxID=2594883 RepID=A0A516KK48_9BACI|nr:GerAB/ArcD/ProY family transporter [Radiobacillus deserti]QDP41768.1 GerAB/ArcD/ProY family transporter [Radiobacillus deserti]